MRLPTACCSPCFSFHDALPLFKEITDAYPWTYAQINNFIERRNRRAPKEGMKYQAKKGIGIVVMEPLRGGLLLAIPAVRDILYAKPRPAHAGRWGWLGLEPSRGHRRPPACPPWSSSCRTSDTQNRDCPVRSKRRPRGHREDQENPCRPGEDSLHRCRYCTPCENGVDIPQCFEFYNQAHIYDAKEHACGINGWALSGIFGGIPGYASCCTECGACEEKCPQGLPIKKHLKEVA